MNRLRSTFSTLAPWQIEVCLGVLVVTFVGALALAYAFKKWNRRNALLED